MRIAIGLVLGVVLAVLVINGVEAAKQRLYPIGMVNWFDPLVAARALRTIPAPGQAMIVAGWLLGSLLGGAAAVRVARRRWTAWVPAALVVVGGIANALLLPQPWWMDLAAVVAPVAGGWLAVRLTRRRVPA